jgi:hypothetical protein
MEKYIKDGKVAVLYSPSFGAGWSTWNYDELRQELLYSPAIVEMVLAGKNGDEISKYCEKTYGDTGYFGGAKDLQVEWMPVGTKFLVREYDGSESIQYMETSVWSVA